MLQYYMIHYVKETSTDIFRMFLHNATGAFLVLNKNIVVIIVYIAEVSSTLMRCLSVTPVITTRWE